MPTYNYKCTECEKAFEAFKRIADRDNADCPTCGGAGVKQLSAPSISLDQSFPGQNMKWGRERKKLNSKLSPRG